MKYFVIAKRWSDKEQNTITYIAGQFETYMNAEIFKKAYNEHYNANAAIVEAREILEGALE